MLYCKLLSTDSPNTIFMFSLLMLSMRDWESTVVRSRALEKETYHSTRDIFVEMVLN